MREDEVIFHSRATNVIRGRIVADSLATQVSGDGGFNSYRGTSEPLLHSRASSNTVTQSVTRWRVHTSLDPLIRREEVYREPVQRCKELQSIIDDAHHFRRFPRSLSQLPRERRPNRGGAAASSSGTDSRNILRRQILISTPKLLIKSGIKFGAIVAR